MTATKYFINPFGQSGDLTPIPDPTQPSGSVSYNEGFPINYQLVQTDPSALDVPRTQFNQLMYDITLNLQQYQQVGAPNFITSAQNGGSAFPYNAYSIVTYDDGTHGPRIFMSKINSNTNLPTDTAAWLWIDNTSGSVVFDNATFDVSVNQGDAVYFDIVSSKFKQALSNGTIAQNVIGFADVTFSRVFNSGDVNFLSGLTGGQIYYLSATTPGQITNILPASINIVQVGFSKSSTELFASIEFVSYPSIQFSGPNLCVDASPTANIIVGAISPSIPMYRIGLNIYIRIANMNTGNVIANMNSLGNVPVLSGNGNQLNPGDLRQDMIAQLFHDGTVFILMNPCKNAIGFRAQLTSDQTFPSNVITKVLFNNLISNINSNYDTINSRFICEVPGYYNIKASCESDSITSGSAVIETFIYKNSVSISSNSITITDITANEEALFGNPSYFGFLNIGDIIEIFSTIVNPAAPVTADVSTYFEAFRVY